MRLLMLVLLAAGFVGGASPASAEQLLVVGAIAEPADVGGLGELAAFEVRLVDVTDPDAAPVAVAGSKLTPGTEHPWPLPFRIGVDSGELAAGRTYAVEARIVGDGVLFETEGPVPVDPSGRADVDVRWAAEEAGPGGLARPQLSFSGNRVSGRVGCRSLRGRTEFSGHWLTLSEVSLDGMGCGAEAAAHEEAFAVLVSRVRRFAIEDGVLVLQAADGAPLVRLTEK
jgi:uncharacterized lipoprotein YbaY